MEFNRCMNHDNSNMHLYDRYFAYVFLYKIAKYAKNNAWNNDFYALGKIY